MEKCERVSKLRAIFGCRAGTTCLCRTPILTVQNIFERFRFKGERGNNSGPSKSVLDGRIGCLGTDQVVPAWLPKFFFFKTDLFFFVGWIDDEHWNDDGWIGNRICKCGLELSMVFVDVFWCR